MILRVLNHDILICCEYMNKKIASFKQTVFDFYWTNQRSLPWRETRDPYEILVSEIMLQQTQVERVVPKYQAFLKAFPSLERLAAAPVTDVLQLWQGLGYNRRGLALQKAAQKIMTEYGGVFPSTEKELIALPGIGPYTASAICVFAFSQPVTLIETNVRRVFLHHFFADKEGVSDKELLPLIEQALDRENPREWYYALMDYGSWLGKQVPNPNRRSKHYTRQSTFQGSNRQLRGAITRFLLQKPDAHFEEVQTYTSSEPDRLQATLTALHQEGFPIPGHLI